jgi:hypothetical protein
MKLLGIISVDLDVIDQLLISYSAFIKHYGLIESTMESAL